MQEDIFSRILSGTAGDKEKEDFYLLLERDKQLRELFYRYKNIYVISSCNAKESDKLKKESFAHFWKRVQGSRRIIPEWFKYVAIFIIAVAISVLIRYWIFEREVGKSFVQYVQYTSERGSISKVCLDDGSQVWLGSGTHLSVRKDSDGKMTAYLEGEAFFDLIPNSLRNFVLDLGDLKIHDIGTRFDVRAYSEEPFILATLVKGKIDLRRSSGVVLHTMNPGDYLQYNKKSRQFLIVQRDTLGATAWKDGKFVFIDKTLAEICKELENWYDVQIRIENRHLADTRYTCIVRRTMTIDRVLDLLSVTDKIHYKIINKEEGKNLITIKK